MLESAKVTALYLKYTETNGNDGGTCMMDCGANANYLVHIEFFRMNLDTLILSDSKDDIYSIR